MPMSRFKTYQLNPETLLYEAAKVPGRQRVRKYLLILLGSIAFAVLYFWLYTSVLGYDPPKTAILKKQNAEWISKMEIMNRDIDRYEAALGDLEMRNSDIYRSIFGMNQIPEDALASGMGGPERYAFMDGLGNSSVLKQTYIRLDRLMNATYVQSKSYDEVANQAKRVGDMASCIPAICPIVPDRRHYRMTSSFGYRVDPVYGGWRYHSGMDFAMKAGNPIYATGDGVVESVDFMFYGYGNQVVINHGFGYKTRYAHMSKVFVVEGMKIKRGECIGQVGNSGKTTGPHLHYEVLYRGSNVNPANFLDLDIPLGEYKAMLVKTEGESEANLRPTFRPRVK